jgi:hypothetical protein
MLESHIHTSHTPVSTVETEAPVLTTAQKGRPRKFDKRKAVTIYVSEADWKWIRLQSGELSVSEWCGEVLLSKVRGQQGTEAILAEYEKNHPEHAEIDRAALSMTKGVAEQLHAIIKEAVKPVKKVKTCAHGKEKGYHCWQCRGLANVE